MVLYIAGCVSFLPSTALWYIYSRKDVTCRSSIYEYVAFGVFHSIPIQGKISEHVLQKLALQQPVFATCPQKIFVWTSPKQGLQITVVEKYMALSLHIGSYGFSTNLYLSTFDICTIYFYVISCVTL